MAGTDSSSAEAGGVNSIEDNRGLAYAIEWKWTRAGRKSRPRRTR